MEKVKSILEDLEKKHSIKIIFACDAGSRAWNLDSEESDFDIRFIFRLVDKNRYFSLKPYKEVIDGFSNDRLYDWQGWDVKKALRHLKDMNPSILEWVFSPIVYYSDPKFSFKEEAEKLLETQGRIIPLCYHYMSMAKSNYKNHVDGKDLVKIKKYLSCIRPAGMLVWLFNNKRTSTKFIEIDFCKVLSQIKERLSHDCYSKILYVIEKKKQLKELDEEPRIKCIDEWLENLFSQKITREDFDKENVKENHTYDAYDEILFRILEIKFD